MVDRGGRCRYAGAPLFAFIDISYETVKIRLDTIEIRRGEKVKKDNRRFVRGVIILSIVGLITMMIIMFIVIQSYMGEHIVSSTYIEPEEEAIVQTVELSETFMVRVEKIEDNHIMGYDIHNGKIFNKFIGETVKISDAYGNVLPISQIKIGDIIEVDYQSQKDKVVSISKSSSVHSWTKISNVTVNQELKQINIAGTAYKYTEDLLVADSNGSKVDIGNIGAFDVVSIQVVDGEVWSIIVEAAAATLNLIELPTSNGQIEIDNSRLLQFKDVTEPIKLVPGKHKLVIKMKGYVTINEELIVEPGQAYELSLKEAEIDYITVVPYISTNVLDYTIKIGDQVFKPGEEIKLQKGTYRVEITAEGYEKWVKNINMDVDKESVPLIPTLIAIEPEEPEVLEGEEMTEEIVGNSKPSEALGSRTITINTEPIGANVYIDGVLKGVTPYTVTLDNGNTYGILLEQTGYDIYSAQIILDKTNNDTAYLYKLIKKAE